MKVVAHIAFITLAAFGVFSMQSRMQAQTMWGGYQQPDLAQIVEP
jgi:hypothetical protein